MEPDLVNLNPGEKKPVRKTRLCIDDVQGYNHLTDLCPEHMMTILRADRADSGDPEEDLRDAEGNAVRVQGQRVELRVPRPSRRALAASRGGLPCA